MNKIQILKKMFNIDLYDFKQVQDLDLWELYIQIIPDVNAKGRDKHKITALIFAVDNNYISLIKLLIDNGSDINTRDNDRNTALMYAVWNNNIKLVKLLLDNGADIDNKNKLNNTPLTYAIKHNNTNIVELLLSNGADVDNENIYGNTPLIYNGNNEIKKLLRIYETNNKSYF